MPKKPLNFWWAGAKPTWVRALEKLAGALRENHPTTEKSVNERLPDSTKAGFGWGHLWLNLTVGFKESLQGMVLGPSDLGTLSVQVMTQCPSNHSNRGSRWVLLPIPRFSSACSMNSSAFLIW